MAICIDYPPSGTPERPTPIPHQLLVYGTKEAGDHWPVAVAYSIDHDGKPTGDFQFTGELFVWPEQAGLERDATKWLFQFPPLPERGLAAVVVFESRSLQLTFDTEQRPGAVITLGGFQTRHFLKRPAIHHEDLRLIDLPPLDSSRGSFTIQGTLPTGDTGINADTTFLTDTASGDTTPLLSRTIAKRDYTVFFATVVGNSVTITVGYTGPTLSEGPTGAVQVT